MKCLAILQARLSSKRLPGKVLLEVNGKPLIAYQIERVLKSRMISELIVATSDQPSDQPLVEYCKGNSIKVECGPLNEVASRFLKVTKKYKPQSFVRICADSPWYDPALLDRGIKLLQEGGYDMVCNIVPRTFPKGVSVELLRTELFERSFPELIRNHDIESFTTFFYDNKDRFKIGTFSADNDYSKENLCVDTEPDLARFRKSLEHLTKPFTEYSWREALTLFKN